MTQEFRRARRRRADQTIEVFDTMTEQVVGRVGNLSESGMMLLANQPMVDDALFQLRITLFDERGQRQPVEVGAHQLWSEEGKAPGQYWAGFRFIDLGPEDGDMLRAWIDAPGSEYA